MLPDRRASHARAHARNAHISIVPEHVLRRDVHVLGRWLAPAAIPQAFSKAVTSEDVQMVSATLTGKQSATPSHQL